MELELKLSTEEEFKRLLQGQLEELRLSARSEQEKLSSEVEKVSHVTLRLGHVTLMCNFCGIEIVRG